ncbi:MAG: 30S ribosomal protein S9 [Candidatus Altiarchaeota archaeon]|nr:30S ribosomal protein S9 [Candidatus Altiarchaeota archaeon]
MAKKAQEKIIQTVGKKKIAVARATLRLGSGKIKINSKPFELWGTRYLRERIREALLLSGELANTVDISVKVNSGGIVGQANAIRTAIGRALAEQGGEKLRKQFIEYDRTLVVPDVRQNEPWKPGRSKPRAAAQKSKR